MPTKLPDTITPEDLDRIIKTVNDQYYRVMDLEAVIRKLEHRIDSVVPTTMNVTVMSASKVMWGAALLAAAVGGYIAYTEVRRSNKQD